tara:strand:+ start:573 stop:2612 length:2040 start_codon:yes stop_codon:yes gene_type:complete
MKKIGLFIKSFDSIFTNGCAQQGYFVLKSLRKAGFEANFITVQEEYTNYEIINEPIYNVCDLSVLSEYSLLVFSSLILDNFELLNHAKTLGIKIVNLMVGNYYILNCEEFVFNVHDDVMHNMSNDYIDEVWLMPMYRHAKEYIEFLTNKPVKISPYVWDGEIINKYIALKNINSKYLSPVDERPIDIVLMEPNLSVHKTALPLLVILNRYFQQFPERLGKIHLISKPGRNDECLKVIRDLDIVKCNKIVTYPRVISLEIFHELRKIGSKYALLSTNIRNSLNFLHLECLTLNIPVIHTCIPFKKNKLYFEDSDNIADYRTCLELINKVWKNPNTSQDKKGCIEVLLQYNPLSQHNVDGYKKLVDEMDLYEKPNIVEISEILNNPIKLETEHNLENTGYLISVNSNCNSIVLKKNIDTINFYGKKKQSVNNICIFHKNFKDLDFFVNYSKNLNNLNIQFIDLKNESINEDEIYLYSITNCKFKNVILLDQNTICFLDSQEAERLLDNNNSIVGFKKKNLSEVDTNKTKEHYININSKNFGFNKEMLMFDGKFLIYKNNLNIKIFTNTILKSYNKFKNFIDPSDVLPFCYNILKFPIKLINNSENLIVCIETNDNNLHPIGDSVISDDSMIYINIDSNKGVSEEQLGKLTLVNYKKYIKYNVKQNVFRDYEIDNKKVKITI